VRRTHSTSRRAVVGGALALPIAPAIAPAISLSAGACAPRRQRTDNTLNVGLTFDIDTLNVYSTGFLGDVQAAVVEGLIAPDAQARYVPVLALETPTLANGGVELSPDGRRMTVRYALRPGVTWHDGRPFTAQDVAFTWRAVSNPAFLAESKDGAEDIERIETPDDLTVICHYRRVDPAFAATLFTFGILPRHLLDGVDLNNCAYNDRPIGTGPFMVKAFKRGQYVLTERNPNYWRRDAEGRRLPHLDRMIFRIIPNSNTLMTQLRAGELDLVVQTPYVQAKQMPPGGDIVLERAPLLSWQHLDFNFRTETLRDIAVRRAIAHAIDRRALVTALGGFPLAITSVVVPVLPFHDPDAPEHPFDPDRANRILEAAGYVRGADGVRAKAGLRLAYDFLVQAGRADDELAQQVIIAQLKAIGVDARPDNKTGVAYRQARYKGRYDLNYSAWVTGAEPLYSKFFSTGGSNNGQSYSNPALDEILAQMETTLDPVARRRAAFAMQRILGEDLPTLPLTSNLAVVARTRRLRNFRSNPTNMTPFVDASGWRLET
jgi:peptide/nickel transport system substrate-binding protein